jgi:hypothetical protein
MKVIWIFKIIYLFNSSFIFWFKLDTNILSLDIICQEKLTVDGTGYFCLYYFYCVFDLVLACSQQYLFVGSTDGIIRVYELPLRVGPHGTNTV